MTARRLTEVVEELDITYRQADYWSRRGFIRTYKASRPRPAHLSAKQHQYRTVPLSERSGTGFLRMIGEHEVEVLRVMVQLVALTITPPMAAEIARRLVDHPGCSVNLGSIYITDSGSS